MSEVIKKKKEMFWLLENFKEKVDERAVSLPSKVQVYIIFFAHT